MILHRSPDSSRRASGFSLIEIMIAVVVLATGLLALAALQGALARNSADAKARGAVMAALTSRMNDIRQSPPASGKTWTTADAWVGAAAAQAGTSDLQVVEGVTSYNWNGTGYVTTSVTNPTSVYTRATLTATWTSADGKDNVGSTGKKSLSLSSDVSGRIYGDGSGYPAPDPSGSASKKPIIRQSNPSNTPGVIPIVTGNQATAASNPQPILKGAGSGSRVGTSFDVLNYIPEGTTAKITKRFETEVIKCRCAFGEGGGYSVAGVAQWPAVWDGTTYATYKGTGSPQGVTANAGEDPDYVGKGKKGSGRLQSEQCTECCRDHHDSALNSNLESRFDPEATAVGKFNEAGGVLTAASTGAYVAACRVVKVDGIWKTTADMYQRQYGLLETASDVNGVQAKSGIPSTAATTAFQTYVKDYLSLYTKTSTSAPSGSQAMFDNVARGLNAPATISIAAASTTDNRYLHARGLYVDYLSSAAQSAVGTCDGKSGSAYTECVLAVLPFTTINVTEIVKWAVSDEDVLATNSQRPLYFDVTQPFGGRTTGISTGTATNDSESRTSNSGVAVSDDILGAVDKNGDVVVAADSQSFTVGGGSPGGNQNNYFWVKPVGAGTSLGMSNTYGTCTATGDFKCLSSATLPQDLTLTLSKYYTTGGSYTTFDFTTTAVQCTKDNKNDKAYVAASYTVPVAYKTLQPMNISSATDWNGTAIASTAIIESGTNDQEVATIALSQVPGMAASGYTPITVNFATHGTALLPTVSSCTYTEKSSKITITSVTWNESWATQ